MIPSLPYSLTLSLHFLSLPVSATISHTSCLPLCLFSFACFSRCNSPSLSLSLCRCLSGLRMSLCLPACVPATCLSHCVPHCPSPSRISPHTLPASLTVCLLLSQPVPVTACLLHCLCYCISSHILSPSLPVSLTACAVFGEASPAEWWSTAEAELTAPRPPGTWVRPACPHHVAACQHPAALTNG